MAAARFRRCAAAALFVAVSLAVWTRPASACSCLVTTLGQRVAVAAAVFVGTVTDVSADPSRPSTSRARLDVETVYKGPPGKGAIVETATDSASCGVPFEEARRYLVFATALPNGALTAGLCGGTTDDLSAASTLTPIRASPSPTTAASAGSPESSSSHATPIALAATLLAVVGLAHVVAGRARWRSAGAARTAAPLG